MHWMTGETVRVICVQRSPSLIERWLSPEPSTRRNSRRNGNWVVAANLELSPNRLFRYRNRYEHRSDSKGPRLEHGPTDLVSRLCRALPSFFRAEDMRIPGC